MGWNSLTGLLPYIPSQKPINRLNAKTHLPPDSHSDQNLAPCTNYDRIKPLGDGEKNIRSEWDSIYFGHSKERLCTATSETYLDTSLDVKICNSLVFSAEVCLKNEGIKEVHL